MIMKSCMTLIEQVCAFPTTLLTLALTSGTTAWCDEMRKSGDLSGDLKPNGSASPADQN